MKIFVILIICALQSIYGQEDRFHEVINNAVKAIEEQQESLKRDIPILEKIVLSATEDANTNLTKVIDEIAKDLNDPAQKKALEEFKASYSKLINETNNSAKKILDAYPELIDKYFVPLNCTKQSFAKIEEKIAQLKNKTSENACKERAVERLIDATSKTIDEAKDCVLTGASNFPSIPTGIRYIRDEIIKFTEKLAGLLKNCQQESGAKCIEDATAKVNTEAETIQKYANNYTESRQHVLNLQRESIKRCVSRKLSPFSWNVRKTCKKMRWC